MLGAILTIGIVTATSAIADDITVSASIDTGAPGAAAALRRAEQAVAAARRAGNLWLATPVRLRDARAAADKGDFAVAIAVAEHARREARLALNQAQLERARYLLESTGTLGAEVRAAVRELLLAYDGAAALRVLEQAGIVP